jgi:hypothetical protein
MQFSFSSEYRTCRTTRSRLAPYFFRISGFIANAGLNCASATFSRSPIISMPCRSTSSVPRTFI